MALATVGLAAINGPIDKYFENVKIGKQVNDLFGGKTLSNPYYIVDKDLTDSVLQQMNKLDNPIV